MRDASGNRIFTSGHTVVFSRSGGTSTGSFSATIDNGNGTYTVGFTGVVAGTPSNIHASINGVTVTSTSPTVYVTPGYPSGANSILTASSTTVQSGSSIQVTLTLYDEVNNRILTGGEAISFYNNSGTSTGSFSSVTDYGDGTYHANFTGHLSGTATTLRAYISGLSMTSSSLPSVTVTP